MPTLKGTHVSLSYVQCVLYPVSSSVKSLFFIYMTGHLLDRLYIHTYTQSSPEDIFSLLREREEGRKGERETSMGERSIHQLSLTHSQTEDHNTLGLGIEPSIQARALTGNRTCNLLTMGRHSDQVSHMGQGQIYCILTIANAMHGNL